MFAGMHKIVHLALCHVGYKIAAQMGDRYLSMLDVCEESISRNVTDNLFERHLKPLFL